MRSLRYLVHQITWYLQSKIILLFDLNCLMSILYNTYSYSQGKIIQVNPL
jgi:hypothetical protein